MKAKRSEGEKRDEGTELLHISFFFFFQIHEFGGK